MDRLRNLQVSDSTQQTGLPQAPASPSQLTPRRITISETPPVVHAYEPLPISSDENGYSRGSSVTASSAASSRASSRASSTLSIGSLDIDDDNDGDDFDTPQSDKLIMSRSAHKLNPEHGNNHPKITSETPLEAGVVGTVLMLQFAEAWNIVMLFPFVVFMVQDELGVTDPKMVGLYSGLIASLWSTGQFVTASIWGRMSDKFGRKGPLLFGCLGCALASTSFGFSKSVTHAAISRFVGGALNGNIAILKVVLGDVCDNSNQVRAFSFMSIAWGIGSIFGSGMAGYLAKPCDSEFFRVVFPDLCSRRGLFVLYPYLLPCIVQLIIGLLSFLVCLFFLRETRWGIPTDPGLVAGRGVGTGQEYHRVRTDVSDDDPEDSIMPAFTHFEDDIEVGSAPNRKSSDLTTFDPVRGRLKHKEENLLSEGRSKSENHHPSSTNLHHVNSRTQSLDLDNPELESESDEQKDAARPETEHQPPSFFHTNAFKTTSLYGCIAFTYVIIDETYPLFAAYALEHGGLSFDSSQIGLSLAWTGFILIIYQWFIFPPLANYYGVIFAFRTSAILGMVTFAIFPISGLLMRWVSVRVGWVSLLSLLFLRIIAGCGVFSAVMILMNNSASGSDDRGEINGIGQMFASGARAVGPFVAGGLWSLTVRFQDVPGHQFISFGTAAVTLFGCYLWAGTLSPTLNHVPQK